MSLILIVSIIVRLMALLWSVVAYRRVRDWRMGFLTVMLGLMTLRQALTLFTQRSSWTISWTGHQTEIPGLLVSIMALLAVIFLERMLTEREKTEAARRDSENRFRSLIEQSPFSTVIYRPDGRVLLTNRAFSELWAVTPEALRYLFDRYNILQDEQLETHGIMPYIKRAFAGEAITLPPIRYDPQGLLLTSPLKEEAGRIRWVRGFLYPVMDESGRISEVVLKHEDITERIHLEDELRHAHKLEAIGQLAGGIAHEFNNLLTTLMGNIELAMEASTKEADRVEHLLLANQAAEHAAKLTRQLLTFSRRTSVAATHCNLDQIVRSTVTFLRPTIDRRIQLGHRAAQDTWSVFVDTDEIKQVLMNLCVNSRDALNHRMNADPALPEPFEPSITITLENIRIDDHYCRSHYEARPGDYVCLSVVDNGSGIDQAIHHRIFEPFFTTKDIGYGTGLGLATVYGIVKQHHGWIDVFSEKNRGTTFRIYFPKDPRLGVSMNQVSGDTSKLCGNETILLVDDDALVLRLGQTILTNHGYSVLLAENGEEAIRILSESDQSIHLMIMDLIMPRRSGKEVLQRLQSIDADIRVLVSSGVQSAHLLDELKCLGVADLVPKPFRQTSLLASVRNVLDRHGDRRPR